MINFRNNQEPDLDAETLNTMQQEMYDLNAGNIAIAQGTDLNNLGIGTYYCSGNTVANTLQNTPVRNAFKLIVEALWNSTRLRQTMETYTGTITQPDTYYRQTTTDGWTDWIRVGEYQPVEDLKSKITSDYSITSNRTIFKKVGNVYTLSMLINTNSSNNTFNTNDTIATVPTEYVPLTSSGASIQAVCMCQTYNGTGYNVGNVLIRQNGNISVQFDTSLNNIGRISFNVSWIR